MMAQMMVFLMVFLGICTAMAFLLGVECLESMQRVEKWRFVSTVGSMFVKTTQVNGKSKRDDRDRSNSQSNQPSNNSRAGNGSSHVASSKRRKSNAMDTLCGQGIPSPVVGQFANLDRSPRKRKRRTVVIWDLDETLVLFASLYNGTYAHIHQKDVHTSVALGEQMMTFLLQTLETHFFFSDLHDTDIDHIHKILPDLENELDANTSDQEFGLTYSVNAEEKKARYAQICAIYERSQAVEFLDNENSNAFNAREALVGAIDEFSCGWLREARILLRELDARSANSSKMNDDSPTERTFVNVLVTNTQFVPALCKCLIYGLHKYFPVDQVYSSSKVHKRSCFETIVERYGQRADNDTEVDFLAVGDGLEEEYVSKELGLAFHKVQSHQDLRQLRYSLFQKN
ncbi:TPA: hypothetical protein N0F65_002201 [Lagenidium giganteum]|uniref:protein-tyrosine-phosphatase n=1 Tax=Lagenidium giganteum TaxID=4803 RepID=A0AAV2YN72_9STRA|nr:TPA: hypothetical protein N0F65_002201 [Lagenidium giganteum]